MKPTSVRFVELFITKAVGCSLLGLRNSEMRKQNFLEGSN